VGGNPELVDDHHSGRLVPPGDPEAMAQALADYLREPGLRAQHGQAGWARVQAEFSLDAMVARYLATYDELMNYPANQRRAACAA